MQLHGLDIKIETPKGQSRTGTGSDGKRWVGPPLPCSYGEIKGTRARDGDRVDAYIGPDKNSQKVWVIDQIKPSGTYDECKVMLGFRSKDAALGDYQKAFGDGKARDRIGAVTEMSIGQFQDWVNTPSATKKPVGNLRGYASGGVVDLSMPVPRYTGEGARGLVPEPRQPQPNIGQRVLDGVLPLLPTTPGMLYPEAVSSPRDTLGIGKYGRELNWRYAIPMDFATGGAVMPLDKSGTKASMGRNIATEMKAGRPRAQSIAIALSTARRYAKKASGGRVGLWSGGDPDSIAPELTRDILPPRREPATEGFAGTLNRMFPTGPSRQERAMTEAQRVMDQPTGEFLTEAGVGSAAPYVLGPAVSRIPKRYVAAGAAGLLGSLVGGDKGTAEGTPSDARNAEITKLQEQITGLQAKVVGAQKDIGASKFRGIGEEAGMARQKALEQAAKPFNDAIAAAQDRIRELRGANDEEQNALVRGERMADRARREELARGKPFNQTPVGEQWEKLGPLAPGLVGAGAAALGRLGHGPKIGWKLPVAEGTGAGALASNVPTGWDAFFSPVANPERKAYQTYGQELKVVQHPRAQEFLDYADTLPQYNPVRQEAQKEFFDPLKAGERMAFGAGEGLVGAGTGLASAVGLERAGRGIKSLFGSRPAAPTGSLRESPAEGGRGLPGLPGTAAEAPLPLTAMPESRMLPSPNQSGPRLAERLPEYREAAGPMTGIRPESVDRALALTKRQSPVPEAAASLPASSSPARPAWASDPPAGAKAPGKGYHWNEAAARFQHEGDGTFGKVKFATPSPKRKDSGKSLTAGKGNEGGTEDVGRKVGGVVARALDIARSYARGGAVRVGAITGATGGRTDALPIDVPAGAFVLPADVVSALGEGNTLAGNRAIEKMFGKSSPARAGGGAVPIKISDGEHVLDPQQVARIGGGDMERGHRMLDQFVLDTRKKHIAQLSSLPGPAR